MKRAALILTLFWFLAFSFAMPKLVRAQMQISQEKTELVAAYQTPPSAAVADLQDAWQGGLEPATLAPNFLPAPANLSLIYSAIASQKNTDFTFRTVWNFIKKLRKKALSADVSPLYYIYALRKILI